MKAYFIATCNDLKKDDHGFIDFGKSHRVVGFYPSLKAAKKCVEENWGDLYEDGYYKYAIIEGLQHGIYQTCSRPIFYKWDGDGYKRIHRPKITKGFSNFTL